MRADEAAGLQVPAAIQGCESIGRQRQLHVRRVQSSGRDTRHHSAACYWFVFSLLTSNVIYVLMLSLCTDVTYVAVCHKKVCDIFKLFSEFLFHNVNDYKKLKDLVWLQDELRQSDYDQHVCSSRIPDNPTVSHLPGVAIPGGGYPADVAMKASQIKCDPRRSPSSYQYQASL